MSRIAVLGANGQLGSDLVKILQAKNLNYLAVTRSDFDVSAVDIEQKLNILSDCKYIINCIATTNVDNCENQAITAFTVNCLFNQKLAKFCHTQQITLFYISTDYIFDGTSSDPYLESQLPNPLNIYGISKLAGEYAVSNYSTQYFIFRTSALFGIAGASGKGGNFISTIMNLAQTRESFTIIDDQYTCPTHTLDLAKAIIYFIDNQITTYGIYNCVSSNSCSWWQFAAKILNLSHLDLNKLKTIKYADYQFKAQRPQSTILSNHKLQTFYHMPSWEESLEQYFASTI